MPVKWDSSHISRDSSHISRDSSHISRDLSHISRDSSHISGDLSHISRDLRLLKWWLESQQHEPSKTRVTPESLIKQWLESQQLLKKHQYLESPQQFKSHQQLLESHKIARETWSDWRSGHAKPHAAYCAIMPCVIKEVAKAVAHTIKITFDLWNTLRNIQFRTLLNNFFKLNASVVSSVCPLVEGCDLSPNPNQWGGCKYICDSSLNQLNARLPVYMWLESSLN